MLSWLIWAAGKAGWYFFAWGPQLLICLGLGYLSAKKTGGDLVNWLVAAFLASLIPIGGVIVMLAVWWRAGTTHPDGADAAPGGGTGAPGTGTGDPGAAS